VYLYVYVCMCVCVCVRGSRTDEKFCTKVCSDQPERRGEYTCDWRITLRRIYVDLYKYNDAGLVRGKVCLFSVTTA
jgi:hypothetical protein